MSNLLRPTEFEDDCGGSWDYHLKLGFQKLLRTEEVAAVLAEEHYARTPERVVNALLEQIQGCFQDPRSVLGTAFTAHNQELVALRDMEFVSMCAHHFLPFAGHAHFGYIPNGKIVGLSKIPRLIHALSRRPQIQEDLTAQIADTFMEVVQPQGVVVVMDAVHLCMKIRGVKSHANTRTSAVRGVFRTEAGALAEFMAGINGHR